jgi:hypothetical protein
MLGDQPRQPRLHVVGQRVIGGSQIGEFGLSADRRDRAGVEQRAFRRQRTERAVGMPQPVSRIEQPPLAVFGQRFIVSAQVRDIGELRVEAQLHARTKFLDRRLQRPEARAKGELRRVAQSLIGKYQHRATIEGVFQRRDDGVIQRPGQIKIADLGGECRGDRMHGKGHGWGPLGRVGYSPGARE